MKSVRLKLLLLSIFSILLVAAVALTTSLYSVSKMEEEDSSKLVESICETEKEKMNGILSGVQQSVNIMTDIALEDFPGLDIIKNETLFNEYNEKMAEEFISISNHTQSIHTLFYRYNIDLFGPTAGFWYGLTNGIMASKPTTNLSLYDKYDIQNSAWYHIPAEQGKAAWIEPFFNEELGIYVISYVAPVYYQRTFIGVIGIEIDFTIFSEMIDEMYTDIIGNAYIVNKYDKIMYHKDLEFKDDKPAITNDTIEVKSKLFNDMSVVVSIDKANISKEGIAGKSRIIVNTIIVTIVCLTVACYFVVKSTAPIKELSKVSKQLEEGKFDVTIKCTSDDELGDLAISLQHALQEINTRLENVNKLAFIDPLTGVCNKTAYIDHSLRINKDIQKRKFAIVVLHLYNLIPMNEKYGREMGNEFLLSATQFIQSIYNKSNIYRLTGGLFAIILEDSEYERKEALFKSFTEELQEQQIIIEQDEVGLPIAIGMSDYNKLRDKTLEDVYARADKYMQVNRAKIRENKSSGEE